MAAASIPIFTEAGSNIVRMSFKITARKADGTPMAGDEVTVRLEGDGSLAPRHDAKQVMRAINAEGTSEVTWYRRGIYGRDVHATLSVESDQEGCNLVLEANTPTTAQ